MDRLVTNLYSNGHLDAVNGCVIERSERDAGCVARMVEAHSSVKRVARVRINWHKNQ